jgi:hypothetical protein
VKGKKRTGKEGTMLRRDLTELALGLFLFSVLLTNQAFGTVDYTLNISAEQFSVERQGEFTRLSLKGGMELNCPGSPSVPQLLVKLILPAGERIESIETQVLSSNRVSLESPLFPCQHPEEISDRATAHPFVGPNMEVYSSSDPYPTKLAEVVEEGYWGRNHLVTLAVVPLRYCAAEGMLVLINSLHLQIQTVPVSAEKQISLGRFRGLGNPVSPQVLEKVVSNKEDVSRFSAPGAAPKLTSGTAAEYVIITSEALASAFEPLAEWKTQKGVPAKIVLLSEIESAYPGVDAQEKIRNFLMEAYMSGLKWVLLGGDERVVPIKYCYPYDTNTQQGLAKLQITDLYYADLTGDWEVDGDGIWGEKTHDSPDLYPELYIGRVPANTPQEASNWVEKLLTYERNPGGGDFSYLTKALWICADEMRDYNQHDYVAAVFPDYFTKDLSSLIEEPSGYDPNPTQPAGNQVIEVMDQGWHLINNLNHGNPDNYSCMSSNYNGGPTKYYVWGDTLFEPEGGALTHLDSTQNYGIHYSISCYTGAFDMEAIWSRPTPNSFGEVYVLLRHRGGVAFCGNSRVGWVHCSYLLQAKFFELAFQGGEFSHLGVAEAISKNSYPRYRDLNYGHNLLGDPEMPIWIDTPNNLHVECDSSIKTTDTMFEVCVTSQGAPLENAEVCLYKGEEVYARGLTNSQGHYASAVYATTAGILYATVTKEGYLPCQKEVRVEYITVADGPDPENLPREFALFQNYPNPFNPSTNIVYHLPEDCAVSLGIYNILGEKVKSVREAIQKAGVHSLTLGSEELQEVSTGIYFYTLRAGDFCDTKKMMLLR